MKIEKLNRFKVLQTLPKRKKDGHKGNYGKVLLLCGSTGYTGAAALAAMGALRSGAGLVYLAVPKSIYVIEATKLTEPVVFPVEEKDGRFSEESITQIKPVLPKMDAVLIGPGIGQSDDVSCFVRWLLENFEGPVVVDADGINVMTEHKNVLRDRTSPTVLTPHQGEFVRFCGLNCTDRLSAAVALSRELGVITVLKGYRTVITDGETVYVNPTGNPGMAVGGSGDMLAGMIASFLGQGVLPLSAAACAAWLHGAAGDACERRLGQYGMLPSDMLDVLPRLLR